MEFGEKKESPKEKLPDLFDFVDKNKEIFIETLRKAVAIRSVSTDEKRSGDVTQMINFCEAEMKNLGLKTELIYPENAKREGGSPFPPILLADLFADEELKTMCIYCHIDTVSKSLEKNSEADNFDLKSKNEIISGPGVSKGKGAFVCWLNALKSYKSTGILLPVNAKFIVEGSAELHNPTLQEVVQRKKEFFKDVDFVCFALDESPNEIPCLRYGYRGVCHFSLTVSCGEEDVDSGSYGGAFRQPLVEAALLLSSLTNEAGEISLPDVLKDVVPVTEENFKENRVNVGDLKQKMGVKRLRHEKDLQEVLKHQTQLPCVSVHEFETRSRPDGQNRALVPGRVVAKFSIRLVPNQTVKATGSKVEDHLRRMWSRYGSPNEMEIRMDSGFDPWREDPSSGHYEAAASAIKMVYNEQPIYVLDGYSLPAVSIISSISTQSSALVLALGSKVNGDENEETVSIDNYLKSIKVLMAYMCYVNEL